mmetsp:Transcript_41823/g.105458  ORF Transcript_41823/g.105458 Transcript_41823/m.105458 type:complete len:304 (+) Transcript_41823:1919-2830(+)
MITLRSFFLERNPLLEKLRIWERDSSQTLQNIIAVLAQPKGSTRPNHFESLDTASVWQMRTSAQIDEVTTAVDSASTTIRDLRANQVLLVLVVTEEVQRFLFGSDNALEGSLLLGERLDKKLKHLKVIGINSPSIRKSTIVEETITVGRAMSQMRTVEFLHRPAQDVSATVPEGIAALLAVKLDQFERAVLFKRTLEIPDLAVHTCDHHSLSQTLRDRLCNTQRRCLSSCSITNTAIRKCDLDCLAFNLRLSGKDLLELVHTLLPKVRCRNGLHVLVNGFHSGVCHDRKENNERKLRLKGEIL